jgi:hypothetical protein
MRVEVILQRLIVGGVVAVALVYAGDYVWARHRMVGTNPAVLGSVIVHREIDIPRKDGRVEMDFEPAEAVSCVRAIFPHFGYSPCWYVARHATVRE